MRALPLPSFVLHPFTSMGIGVVHLYLASGHLSEFFGGAVEWTHFWKGFGALGGAYVFAAVASRGLAANEGRQRPDRLTCKKHDPNETSSFEPSAQ